MIQWTRRVTRLEHTFTQKLINNYYLIYYYIIIYLYIFVIILFSLIII